MGSGYLLGLAFSVLCWLTPTHQATTLLTTISSYLVGCTFPRGARVRLCSWNSPRGQHSPETFYFLLPSFFLLPCINFSLVRFCTSKFPHHGLSLLINNLGLIAWSTSIMTSSCVFFKSHGASSLHVIFFYNGMVHCQPGLHEDKAHLPSDQSSSHFTIPSLQRSLTWSTQ